MLSDPAKSRISPSGRVKTGVALCALAGIALAMALVVYVGSAQVGDAFLSAGWRGLAAMTVFYLASVTLCAFAWQILSTTPPRNAIAVFHWARLLRDSVANILAIIPGAGEAIAARELTSDATTEVDVVPEVQVTLSARQHIRAAAGVQGPVTERSRDTAGIVYVLWDIADGGLLEGW